MSKTIKRILLGLVVLLVLIQFFRIDKNNPPAVPSKDFLNISAPPAEIAGLIRSACYDCHSHETKYPWYTNVAPVSWWIWNHIVEGREELNFSTWTDYPLDKRAKKLEEAAELVRDGEMPLKSYTIAHGEARITTAQRDQLAAWFESEMQKTNVLDIPTTEDTGQNRDDDDDYPVMEEAELE
jgi:hypothetical protein